jgi:hypothetical protein
MFMQQGQYSQRGMLFAHQILQLGEDGFAKWLADSFAGPQVNPRPGYFHDDDLSFDQVFGMVFGEFQPDALAVVKPAVAKACRMAGPDTSEEGKNILADLSIRVA